MKKIIFGTLMAATLFVAGCSSKTVKFSSEEVEAFRNGQHVIETNFNGDVNARIEQVVDLDEYLIDTGGYLSSNNLNSDWSTLSAGNTSIDQLIVTLQEFVGSNYESFKIEPKKFSHSVPLGEDDFGFMFFEEDIIVNFAITKEENFVYTVSSSIKSSFINGAVKMTLKDNYLKVTTSYEVKMDFPGFDNLKGSSSLEIKLSDEIGSSSIVINVNDNGEKTSISEKF